MQIQLINQIKLAKYYSLQLDESTDISNKAILMVHVRYEYEGELKKEFLFFAALPQRTTVLEISKTINNCIENNGLDIKNCVRVCSDGVATKRIFLQNVFQLIAFFTGKVLQPKKLSSKVNNVLCGVVKIIDHIY